MLDEIARQYAARNATDEPAGADEPVAFAALLSIRDRIRQAPELLDEYDAEDVDENIERQRREHVFLAQQQAEPD